MLLKQFVTISVALVGVLALLGPGPVSAQAGNDCQLTTQVPNVPGGQTGRPCIAVIAPQCVDHAALSHQYCGFYVILVPFKHGYVGDSRASQVYAESNGVAGLQTTDTLVPGRVVLADEKVI